MFGLLRRLVGSVGTSLTKIGYRQESVITDPEGEINILTDGGPGRATTNLVYQVFVDGFVGTRFIGRASAQAFLLAVLVIVISVVQFRGLGSRRVQLRGVDPASMVTRISETPSTMRRSIL